MLSEARLDLTGGTLHNERWWEKRRAIAAAEKFRREQQLARLELYKEQRRREEAKRREWRKATLLNVQSLAQPLIEAELYEDAAWTAAEIC